MYKMGRLQKATKDAFWIWLGELGITDTRQVKVLEQLYDSASIVIAEALVKEMLKQIEEQKLTEKMENH